MPAVARPAHDPFAATTPVRVYAPALLLGFMAVITQTVLTREALSAASGHELMFGVVLTGWLLGQALCLAATWRLGRKLRPAAAITRAGLLIPLSLILLRVVTAELTPVDGTLPQLPAVAPAILLCTLPAGLGLALAFSAVYHRARCLVGPHALLPVYAAETLGFFVGGLVWTFALSGHVSHLLALCLVPGLTLLSYCCETRHPLVLAIALAGACGICYGGVVFWRQLDPLLAPRLPEGVSTVAMIDGRHARWQVGEYAGEHSFYRNGRLLFSTGQPGPAAEVALLPLAQTVPPQPQASEHVQGNAPQERVLYLGPRYPGNADYFALNPGVSAVWLEYDEAYSRLYDEYVRSEGTASSFKLTAPLVPAIRATDGLAEPGWDAVVLNLGPPTSPEVAWVYDRRFLTLVRDSLTPDGVLALSLDAEENYNSPALASLHWQVLAKLRDVFPRVLITPPSPVWYFAGDDDATPTLDPVEIEERLAARGIASPYLSRWVLADRLDPGRAGGWQQPEPGFAPAAATLSLAGLRAELLGTDPRVAQALGRLAANRLWLGGLLALLLLVPALGAARSRTCPAQLNGPTLAFLGGFSCLAGEIVLAWELQGRGGQLYWLVALLTATVLAGLFAGTVLSVRLPRGGRPVAALPPAALLLTLGGTAALVQWGGFGLAADVALWLLAAALPLSAGTVIGTALQDTSASAARLYAADLLGAALAALLVGTAGMIVWGPLWCLAAVAALWLVVTARAVAAAPV